LKHIGIVASGATETSASVILNEGEEKTVKVEDLVQIENRNGNRVLAVCRGGHGENENLKTIGYSPGVAYARKGRKPSSAKEFYAFRLAVIGDIGGKIDHDGNAKLAQNKLILAPSSDVNLFEDHNNPMDLLGESELHIGYYKEHPDWKVPVDKRFIPYHLGVFAVTGGGKSFLARFELIPLLGSAGYDVIIFDWKGSDYAPNYPNAVVNFDDISLDDDVVVNYLASKMDYFGFGGDYRHNNQIIDALEDVIYKGDWRDLAPSMLLDYVEHEVVNTIEAENTDAKGGLNAYGRRYIRKFRKAIAKLDEKDVEFIAGKQTPEDIVKLAREKHIIVIDISTSNKDVKLSIFLSIAKHLQDLMEKKQKLNIALLIDEGPQYAPWDPHGIERDTTETITELCALGRSYHLCVVLLSQGIAGEIGINAAVRRNLNTQFIGKIHPLDIAEASRLLSELALDPNFLVSLAEGHFYFLGNMNPSPVPLLITFDITEKRKK